MKRKKWPYPAEAEMHIRSELIKCGVDFETSSTDFKLRCPFVDCQSRKKLNKRKLEIRKDGRTAHCWSCGRSGTWNSMAPHIGAAPFNSEARGLSAEVLEINMFDRLADELRKINSTQKELRLPIEELDIWNGVNNNCQSWRGLSVDFLQKIPTFAWHQKTEWGSIIERILFPFYQHEKLMGYSGRRLDGSNILPYFNADFMPAQKVFYPFDYVIKTFKPDRIALVEGQVDALWFLFNQIPALSIQGTNNWSSYKRDLLVATGIKKVLICMDPDKAGYKAAPLIFGDLNPIMENVINLELPEKTDPAETPVATVNWIRDYLYNL